MQQSITLDPSLLNIARAPGRRPLYTRRDIARHAERLCSQPVLSCFEVEDLLLEATQMTQLQSPDVVVQLTGISPEIVYDHPGKGRETQGCERFSPAAVAWSLILLRRLGVDIDVAGFCEPLRHCLANKRQHPQISLAELNILWHIQEDSEAWIFTWNSHRPPQDTPYAMPLFDGRVAIGFTNRNDEYIEVIAKPNSTKLHDAVMNSGGSRLDADLQKLARQPRQSVS